MLGYDELNPGFYRLFRKMVVVETEDFIVSSWKNAHFADWFHRKIIQIYCKKNVSDISRTNKCHPVLSLCLLCGSTSYVYQMLSASLDDVISELQNNLQGFRKKYLNFKRLLVKMWYFGYITSAFGNGLSGKVTDFIFKIPSRNYGSEVWAFVSGVGYSETFINSIEIIHVP